MQGKKSFGQFVREGREARAASDRSYSLRQVARKVGIEPSYLSKIERDLEPPPGEEVICRLAEELDENPDRMLAMAGKVSQDLLDAICLHPEIFADLLRQLRKMPRKAVLRIAREVRDGNW